MNLNTVDKSLEIVLGSAVAANQAVYSAVYMDVNQTSFKTENWDSVDGESNSTTPVEMVSSPASGVSRLIEEVNIYNTDTAAIEVTVRINNNSTIRPQVTKTIPVDKTLQYTRSEGWKLVDGDATGNVEAILGDASSENPFADTTNIIGINSVGQLVKDTWANIKTALSSVFATLLGGNTFSGVQNMPDGLTFDGGANVLDYYKQGRMKSLSISIANDDVYTIADLSTRCILFAWLVKSSTDTIFASFQLSSSLPTSNLINQSGSLYEVSTGGNPTGTTGTDNKITFFSGSATGRLDIENREGSTRTLHLFILEES